MKNYDPKLFTHDLSRAPWGLLDISDDQDDVVWTWENLFLEVFEIRTSLRKRRVQNKSPTWLTPFLKEQMYKRDYLAKQYIKKNSYVLFKVHKVARNEVNSDIKKAKKDCYCRG